MKRIDRVHTKYGVFSIPSGMRGDLVRKLVEDDLFSHAWLCHDGDIDKCSDGCNGSSASEERVKLYSGIERIPA